MFDGEDATSVRPGSVINTLRGLGGGGDARVRVVSLKSEFATRTYNSILIASTPDYASGCIHETQPPRLPLIDYLLIFRLLSAKCIVN